MRSDRCCEMCGISVADRHHHTRFCFDCAAKRGRMAARRWQSPSKSRCHRTVWAAVRRGDLPALDGTIPCVDCGAPARHYDHRDYRFALFVQPVCRSCNKLRGPGLSFESADIGSCASAKKQAA